MKKIRSSLFLALTMGLSLTAYGGKKPIPRRLSAKRPYPMATPCGGFVFSNEKRTARLSKLETGVLFLEVMNMKIGYLFSRGKDFRVNDRLAFDGCCGAGAPQKAPLPKAMSLTLAVSVGADAHIGPCAMLRIRRNLAQKIQLSLRGDVGIAPYGGLLYSKVNDIALGKGGFACPTPVESTDIAARNDHFAALSR